MSQARTTVSDTDLQNLYVYASQSAQKGPLVGVTVLQSTLATKRIRCLEYFRTITVKGFPAPGALPSEGLRAAWPQLMARLPTRCRPAVACTLAGSTLSSSRDSRILAQSQH